MHAYMFIACTLTEVPRSAPSLYLGTIVRVRGLHGHPTTWHGTAQE
jgi:hypothetical protein